MEIIEQVNENVCPKTGEEHATWEQDNHEQKCLDCGEIT